jgi:hypothetical protein
LKAAAEVKALIAIILIALASCAEDMPLRRLMPLGTDSVLLRPGNHVVSIFATQQCEECGNLVLAAEGNKHVVRDVRGETVRTYPQRVFFRVTATERMPLQDAPPVEYSTKASAQQFMSTLRFRLLVFDGLQVQELKPAAADIIGVPPEVPYSERIYLVAFDLKDVPVERRMSLEVLDAEGSRVTKFPAGLF